MDRTTELKSRVDAKRKQLEADLARAKANAQGKANDVAEGIALRLRQVEEELKGGWENLSEGTVRKLNQWLKD